MRNHYSAAVVLLICLAAASAQDVPRSQLVVVGDVDSLLVGQVGYCGNMERVDKADLKKIAVPSTKKTWVRFAKGGTVTGTCSLDFSFNPMAEQHYIARYTLLPGMCQVELFRIRPGLDPAPAGLTPEATRSCLFK